MWWVDLYHSWSYSLSLSNAYLFSINSIIFSQEEVEEEIAEVEQEIVIDVKKIFGGKR